MGDSILIYGFTTCEAIGWHEWPDAPQTVDYLRCRHRHLFKLRVDYQQFHSDRDLEYHTFQAFAQQTLENALQELPPSKSCETIALHVLAWCQTQYPGRHFKVEVSEDGENGAVVYSILKLEASPA